MYARVSHPTAHGQTVLFSLPPMHVPKSLNMQISSHTLTPFLLSKEKTVFRCHDASFGRALTTIMFRHTRHRGDQVHPFHLNLCHLGCSKERDTWILMNSKLEHDFRFDFSYFIRFYFVWARDLNVSLLSWDVAKRW